MEMCDRGVLKVERNRLRRIKQKNNLMFSAVRRNVRIC